MIRLAGPISVTLVLATCCAAAMVAEPAVAAGPAEPARPAAGAGPAKPAAAAAGVSREPLAPPADPCVDFYRYACGGWMAQNPVPADQPAWSRFSELTKQNRAKLRDILEADAADRPDRPDHLDPIGEQRKVGAFYATCMDEDGVEKRGLASIQPDLDHIAALASPAELPALAAHLRQVGVNVLFRIQSGQDYKDATSVIAVLEAGGLALPDRDYYLAADAKSAEQRAAYSKHLQRMFALLGEPAERAAADAAAVLEIETALAKATLDRVSRRDPAKVYHKLTRQQLQALTPSFSWDAYLAAVGAPPVGSLNVAEPDFLRGVEDLLHHASVAQWQTYLRWQVLHAAAPWLPRAFAAESFDFFDKTLGGAQRPRPRWDRCVEETDGALGQALGRQYVAAWFDPDAKRRTQALVAEIEKAMARDIDGLTWMGRETKQRAEEKLAAVANKVGYPDTWRDYGSLAVVRGDLVGNIERAEAFELARRLAKIGKPVDRRDWIMTPPTVNAYYRAELNDINFPAGILQPPFYDPKRDDAANYGAIGAAIGHELTHGFDDRGSQFDGHGNLVDWWTPADQAEFKQRTACVADEYSAFPAAGGLTLNGRLTLGENTADNGGLRLAYMAFEASQDGKTRQSIDGLTPEQRFFVGFAQVWCVNTTPEAERRHVLTNPHSPGRYRVDGTVVNMPEFQQAFSCKAGTPMAPEKRCRVW
ncbi:MAG TPA: M13 family metallopeptidase [Thermoanaerobaculia bacterium]|nr:M13 family metallopeptidase [Thermoanaerobaculia bacterium]